MAVVSSCRKVFVKSSNERNPALERLLALPRMRSHAWGFSSGRCYPGYIIIFLDTCVYNKQVIYAEHKCAGNLKKRVWIAGCQHILAPKSEEDVKFGMPLMDRATHVHNGNSQKRRNDVRVANL